MYLENVVVDALDPQRLGRFWEALLGCETLTDEPANYETRLTVPDGPVLDLCFERVTHPPTPSPRLHLEVSGGERQAEVARLIGVRRFHLLQQKLPGLVIDLQFAILVLREIEGLGGLAQPVARDGAADLLQLSLRGEDLIAQSLMALSRPHHGVGRGGDFLGADRPFRHWESVVALQGLLEPALGGGEIQGLALSPALDELPSLARVIVDGLRERCSRGFDALPGLLHRLPGLGQG
jgi:hypothetical protein